MALAQEGDAQAYRTLLAAIHAKFLPVCRSKVGHLGSHEDCLQEILLAVHNARHTYDPSRPFMPWLNAVARFKIIDHLRSRTRVARMEIADPETLDASPAPAPESSESDPLPERLSAAIESLDPKYKSVLMMVKVEGLSVKETAARLSLSVSAVKVRASRAYEMLRKKLEKSLASDF